MSLNEQRLAEFCEKVEKGSIITAAEVTYLTGVPQRPEKEFRYALLTVRELVQDACHVTVCEEDGQLLVLDDAAAAKYNAQQYKLAFGKFYRANERNKEVDVTKLNDIERAKFDRDELIASRKRQALKDVGRAPELQRPPLWRRVSQAVEKKSLKG